MYLGLFESKHPAISTAQKSLRATIDSSKFSSQANGILSSANTMLDKINILDEMNLVQKNIDKIMIGSLIFAMTQDDAKYGKQAEFGNELLYPFMTMDELNKLDLSDFMNGKILAIGEMVINKSLPFDSNRTMDVFPIVKNNFPKNHFDQYNVSENDLKTEKKLA